MPVYDFRCGECGNVSEVSLRSESSEVPPCPNCGSSNLERLISASYAITGRDKSPGTTCCGRTERCDAPPCSNEGGCRRG